VMLQNPVNGNSLIALYFAIPERWQCGRMRRDDQNRK
jgi:hypothetical protein